MMDMEERRPIALKGEAVDPWAGHPLFYDYRVYDPAPPIVVPVIVGYQDRRGRGHDGQTVGERKPRRWFGRGVHRRDDRGGR